MLAPTLLGIFFSLLLSYAFSVNEDGVYLHTRSNSRLFNLERLRAETKVKHVTTREDLFADDAALATRTQRHSRDSSITSHMPVKSLALLSASKRPK